MKFIRRVGKSNQAGTALVGCISLLTVITLGGLLVMLRPSGQALIPVETAPGTHTATRSPTATSIGISITPTIWLLPTHTLPPTRKVDATPTSPATASPLTTPSIEPASPPLTSCVPGRPQQAKVVDVIDGDTIKVLLDGLVVKVKYIGIDAPESVSRLEYLGKEAKLRNRELVYGRDVLLYKDVSERDRFDRLLRYVFVENRFINYELVSLGYAGALDEPPDESCTLLFEQAAARARDRSLGIWAPHTPLSEQSIAASSLIIYSVNAEGEFVDIQNVAETQVDLSGWKLLSEQGRQECELKGMIHPSEIMRIFSGIDQPGFSCGFETPIWLDTESDPAVLYDPSGVEVDRYP